MADPFAPKTMKRKNKKGLALSAPPPKPAPSESDAQAPGGLGNGKEETLEIGVEFQLDLKAEDLIVLRELGSGNGGTVSKVQHAATKVIMARKVRERARVRRTTGWEGADNRRSYTSKRRTKYGNASCESCASCTTATQTTLSTFTVPSRMTLGTLSCAWSTWMWGKQPCQQHPDGQQLTCCNSALDWVSRQFGPVRVDVLGKIAEAVLGGLSYLYSAHRIMHRDLKPSNILVNSKGQIKLCDFGVSSELDGSIAETFVGTGTYMAPERIQGSPYTVKSDVWSVGLSIMELAIGKFPFSGSADDDEAGGPQGILDLLQQIVLEPAPKLPKSDAFPSILEDMVAKCLLKDPKERPTPKELYVRFCSVFCTNLLISARTTTLSSKPRSAHQSTSKHGRQACSNTISANHTSLPPCRQATFARSYRTRSLHQGEDPPTSGSRNPRRGEVLQMSGKTMAQRLHVRHTLREPPAASAITASRTASQVKVVRCLFPCDLPHQRRMDRIRDPNREGRRLTGDCHLRRGECIATCSSQYSCV